LKAVFEKAKLEPTLKESLPEAIRKWAGYYAAALTLLLQRDTEQVKYSLNVSVEAIQVKILW